MKLELDGMIDESWSCKPEYAQKRYDKREVVGLLCCISKRQYIRFACLNAKQLLHAGIYEETLAEIFTMGERIFVRDWQFLLFDVDRDKLRAAGDVQPPATPVTVYRGVAHPRHCRGMGWTTDIEVARWFARRWGSGYVYSMVVKPEHILFCTNSRNESAVAVAIWDIHDKLKRVEKVDRTDTVTKIAGNGQDNKVA